MRTTDRLALDARVGAGPDTYRFATADGVCSADSFRTAELLLVERLWERDVGRLLSPEANYGVVGTVLAATADRVTMTESSARAATLCRRNCRANDAATTVERTATLTDCEGPFDTIAYAPKPYTALAVAKQRIADGLAVLRPGGRMFLSAATQTGLSRYEACLSELTESVETVATTGDYELLTAARPERFERPSYVEPRSLRATVDGVDLPLVSLPGLFSAGTLDDGTRLLAETTAVADSERVLDLCCGYGPLGVYAASVADCAVWLSDDDCRATAAAARSLDRAGVDGTVVTSDATGGVAEQTFDRVLCNPPTHAGSGVLADLFDGVAEVLAPDGRLELVHHRALDLGEYLDGFGRVERTARGDEHVVLTARPA